MKTIASYLDMRSSKNTHDQIIRLTDYISGKLDEKTVRFLEELCLRNACGLEKIITKCIQLKVSLKASDINVVIAALNQQHALPHNTLDSLQYFLMNQHTHDFLQGLMASTEYLNAPLNKVGYLKTTIQIMNQVAMYHHAGAEKDFLTTIISMMLYFYHGEYTHNDTQAKQHNTEDTAKWMKSLLSISDKSDISKLIDLLANRIFLISTSLPGEIRNMDLIELYCLFEDLSLQTHYHVAHDSNRSLLADIQVMMLLALVSTRAPNAFFDIVYTQQSQINQDILDTLQNQITQSPILANFLNGQTFKAYFRECGIRTHSNQQAFLSSLVRWLQIMSQQINLPSEASKNMIVKFLQSAYSIRSEMSPNDFLTWLSHEIETPTLFTCLEKTLFNALEYEASAINNQTGSLTFVTNKLVSMKLSPKAISASHMGSFQPFITPNVLQIDLDNLRALNCFFYQISYQEQCELLLELCLLGLMSKPCPATKRQSLQKRTANQHYPLPALHRIQKAKQAQPATRIVRKQPTATVAITSNDLFDSPVKTKMLKHTIKYLRH